MIEPRRRLPGERLFSVALLLFSLFVLYQAWRISGFASPSAAGVFPMIAASVMVLSLVAVIARERGGPAPEESGAAAFFRRVTPRILLITLALIVALMLLLEPVGFPVAAGAFLFAAISFLQGGRPLRAALIAGAALAAIWAVFRLVFKVVLPEAEWF